MRKLWYAPMHTTQDDRTWHIHAQEACAKATGTCWLEDGRDWDVSLHSLGDLIEQVRREDVEQGTSSQLLLCLCLEEPSGRASADKPQLPTAVMPKKLRDFLTAGDALAGDSEKAARAALENAEIQDSEDGPSAVVQAQPPVLLDIADIVDFLLSKVDGGQVQISKTGVRHEDLLRVVDGFTTAATAAA